MRAISSPLRSGPLEAVRASTPNETLGCHHDPCTASSSSSSFTREECRYEPSVNFPASSSGPLLSAETSAASMTVASPKPFEGMQLSQLCCLELCAGAGRLSSHLRQSGFITVSVDHVAKRAKPLHKSLRLDLSKPSSAVLLRNLFASHTVCYVHAALPYGTCKRTRSAMLPKHLRLCKSSKARALRSISHPDGVPSMSQEERLRVQSANQVFRNVCSFMSLCCLSNVRVSLENPSNSLLWHVPCIKKLVDRFGLFEVKFQQCMWGGGTAKWTTFLMNCPELACLAKSCDGDHVHRSVAVRRDAQGNKDAAAYPPKLCAAIADAISLAVRSDGAVDAVVVSSAPSASPKLQQQVDANKQPRGDKLPPVISEVVNCRWLKWGDRKPPQASFKLDEPTCVTLGVPFSF